MQLIDFVVPLGTAVTTVIAIVQLLGKKFDKIDERFDRINARFDRIDGDLKDIKSELSHTNERISRIEGYIEGRDIAVKRKTGTGNS